MVAPLDVLESNISAAIVCGRAGAWEAGGISSGCGGEYRPVNDRPTPVVCNGCILCRVTNMVAATRGLRCDGGHNADLPTGMTTLSHLVST